MKVMLFSKHLGHLPVVEAGEVIAELGFEGVDLTVRPGGHVLPENARRELGGAVSTLTGMGLAVPMVTTGITSADDPHAAEIFETAAQAGVRYLKLGYWRYQGFGTIRGAIDAAARDLDGIEALARRTGVCAVIHNHSGDFISALGPVVWELIADRDPAAVGAYADPGHLMVEGGLGGWHYACLLRPIVHLLIPAFLLSFAKKLVRTLLKSLCRIKTMHKRRDMV